MSETTEKTDRVRHWARDVHDLAKAKGWHDEPAYPRRFQMVGNIAGEVAEAWEEARQKDFDPKRIYFVSPHNGEKWLDREIARTAVGSANEPKPEGFPVEIADVVIRALDTMAALGIEDVTEHTVRVMKENLRQRTNPDLWQQLCFLYRTVGRVLSDVDYDDSPAMTRENLAVTVARCEAVADLCGFDLWAVVAIKHAFNGTRSHRHGGKRA